MLSPEERLRVEDAIRRAETGTAGEIVIIMARQASRYRSIPLLYGLAISLALPWPLLVWTGLGVGTVALIQVAAALATVAALSSPAFRLTVTPHPLRRARAREAAQREFLSHGMAETRGRTGILLYMAAAERHAEVIGDVAIAPLVDEAEWRALIAELVLHIGENRVADGLVAAIDRMGVILARHAPATGQNVDELPNRVVLL